MIPSPHQQARRQTLPVINPADKVAELRKLPAADSPSPASHVNRGQDVPERKRQLLDQVVQAIRQVYDPEIPINISDDNSVRVRMTLTAPGCPVAGSLVAEVERRIENISEVPRATVELVWDPPWTREMMSEAARLELGL